MKDARRPLKKEKNASETDAISQLLYQNLIEDPYEGWQSTFGCPVPPRRGHRRVAYAPYVVGGFKG